MCIDEKEQGCTSFVNSFVLTNIYLFFKHTDIVQEYKTRSCSNSTSFFVTLPGGISNNNETDGRACGAKSVRYLVDL